MQVLVYILLVGIIVGLVGWLNQAKLAEQIRFVAMWPYMSAQVRPYVLTTAAEQALKPGDSFRIRSGRVQALDTVFEISPSTARSEKILRPGTPSAGDGAATL